MKYHLIDSSRKGVAIPYTKSIRVMLVLGVPCIYILLYSSIFATSSYIVDKQKQNSYINIDNVVKEREEKVAVQQS